MTWLLDNLATILVGGAVLALLAFVLVRRVRARRRGQSGCGCGCSGCAMRDLCHKE